MTRRERTLRKIDKLQMRAVKSSVRATSQKQPFGRAAIAAGKTAAAFWDLATAMRQALRDGEEAATREEKFKKMPTEWWRPEPKRKRSV